MFSQIFQYPRLVLATYRWLQFSILLNIWGWAKKRTKDKINNTVNFNANGLPKNWVAARRCEKNSKYQNQTQDDHKSNTDATAGAASAATSAQTVVQAMMEAPAATEASLAEA